MAAFKHKVSIFKNTVGRVVLKQDDDGKYSNDNAAECLTEMKTLAAKHKLDFKLWKPKAGGNTPVILADRWGKPYMALLPEQEVASKPRVVKLA